MIKTAQVTLIGFGHMGQALTRGFLQNGMPPSQIHAVDPNPQAQKKAEALGIGFCADIQSFTHTPDVVILAVKPQQMATVLSALRGVDAQKTCFVSIAAGVTLQNLAAHWGEKARLVRAMPNTPACIGMGMTVLCHSGNLAAEQLNLVEALMACVGKATWIDDEALLDVVTGISGSGPAYFYLMMEALVGAGVDAGLTPALAEKLAIQTCQGAGALAAAKENSLSLADLRHAVTSKGGTTQAALEALEFGQFTKIVKTAVEAAKNRSQDLAE